MQKKSVLIVAVILLSLFTLGLPIVSAEEKGPVESIFELADQFFGFIPKTLTPEAIQNDEKAQFYAKFLIWILVFSLMYGGLSKVFKDMPRGVQITVPLILSIISVVLLPGAVLRNIFSSYGVVIGMLMMGAPLILLWFLINRFFDGTHRWHYAARLFLFIVALLLFTDFYDAAANTQLFSGLVNTQMWSWMQLFQIYFIAGAIYSAFQLFGGGIGASVMRSIANRMGTDSPSDVVTKDLPELQKKISEDAADDYKEDTKNEQELEAEKKRGEQLDTLERDIEATEQERQQVLRAINQLNEMYRLLDDREERANAMIKDGTERGNNPEVERGKAELEQLAPFRVAYDQRMEALTQRLAELEGRTSQEAEASSEIIEDDKTLEKRRQTRARRTKKRNRSESKAVGKASKAAQKKGATQAAKDLAEEAAALDKGRDIEKKSEQVVKKEKSTLKKVKKLVKQQVTDIKERKKLMKELKKLVDENHSINSKIPSIRKSNDPNKNIKIKNKEKLRTKNNTRIKNIVQTLWGKLPEERLIARKIAQLSNDLKELYKAELSLEEEDKRVKGIIYKKSKQASKK